MASSSPLRRTATGTRSTVSFGGTTIASTRSLVA